jgi:hypothetical protein
MPSLKAMFRQSGILMRLALVIDVLADAERRRFEYGLPRSWNEFYTLTRFV